MKSILYMATFIGVITYLFWEKLPEGGFYIGNSFFILLLCVYIFLTNRNSYITYVLLCLSLNNAFEEITGQNTILQIKEILFFIIVLIIPLINKNGRKITKLCKPITRLYSKIHNTSNSGNINTSGYDDEKRKDNSA